MRRTKALLPVGGTPLVVRATLSAMAVARDVVVVSRGAPAAEIAAVLPDGPRIVRDRFRIRTPLVGLLAGTSALRNPQVLVVACDLPFLRPALLRSLFRSGRGHDAVIPRWPDGRIEPLLAVYRRVALQAAVRASLAAGERSNQEMLARIRAVRFVPVRDLRAFDPALRSFVNVNTPQDLARARRLAGPTRPAVRRSTR